VTAPTTILDAEVDGRRVDVRMADGGIAAVGTGVRQAGDVVVPADGGALLPGLHDHHLHLLAMAAADRSIDLATPAAAGPAGFDAAVSAAARAARAGTWLRAVGYDDPHGPLDRHRLDRLVGARPIRVQHRSGAAWVLSTQALVELGLVDDPHPGVERDGAGSPTGVLFRLDEVLAERLPHDEPPDLAPVGERLARLGVTGVTDATPYVDGGAFALLAEARRGGALPQRVVVTGGPRLAASAVPAGLGRGPVKVVVTDDALPSIDDLAAAYAAARRAGRSVAVHCVTRVGLVLALAAWDIVATEPGDRIEHGSVIPVELIGELAARGLTVVTQPGFLANRGDRYRTEVEADDQPHLYRCGSLLDAGVAVAGSTDAPFGPEDPWLAIRTAVDRRAASGAVVGGDEVLPARRALGLFLGAPDAPGGLERAVAVGAPADVVLLAEPLAEALAHPSAALVRHTWIAGRMAGDA
jgi:predicted amidohydrolase YtcJ